MIDIDAAELTPQVRSILTWMLSGQNFPGVEELKLQCAKVNAAGGSLTMLDLEVGGDESVLENVPDGVLPVAALVVQGDGGWVGELLIWVRRGFLSGLEFAWWADAPPESLPTIDQLRIRDAGINPVGDATQRTVDGELP